MKENDLLEARLKDFYDRVPDVEDALPFKDYLLKHEDSRMAWYLLGKQYESKGQEQKANYCFSQAGEIYEAFENKPVPVMDEPMQREGSKSNATRWLAIASVVVLLISGYLLYNSLNLAKDNEAEPSEVLGVSTAESSLAPAGSGAKPSTAGQQASAPTADGYDIVSGSSDPDEDGPRMLSQLMTRTGKEAGTALLIKSPKLGPWTDWVESGKPVADVTTGGTPGSALLRWFDPKWCDCTTDDSAAAYRVAEAWKPEQELKLALRSAMVGYRARTGQWPANPEALTGSYPNNTMAGWTDRLTEWFDELKKVLSNPKDGKIPLTVGWPGTSEDQGAGQGVPSGLLAPLAEQPLEIIVDKTNHRLAVLSGNVMLRNYEVGLGGDKTPEGAFVITEKVRNPNGRTDGPFGSRGMTLSDTRYAIHGTNEPDSIGGDGSLGCVRMSKEDLEELFDLVPLGTKVTLTKGGLPAETRVPTKKFRLPAVQDQDETNPGKVYDWLG